MVQGMKTWIIPAVAGWLLLTGMEMKGQTVQGFTLEEAQAYALTKNYTIRNSATDVGIARKKVNEMTAIGLPQVSAKVDYMNYFALPTSLIPGDFFGKPGEYVELQFGVENNMTAEATLSQLIFDGSYIIGLQASKTYVDVSRTLLQKNQNDLKQNIADAYYNVAILEESLIVVDSTLLTLKQMLYEVQETYESGFIEDTDVDQIDLLVADLETSRMNLIKQLEISYNYLKFLMGMKIIEPIRISENMDMLIMKMNEDILLGSSFDYQQHVDYQLVKGQELLKNFNLRVKKSAYLPSLVGFVSYSFNAQRTSFDFFKSGEAYPWFSTGMFGLSLNIPILSSGGRNSAVQQATMELEKVQVINEQVKEGLLLEYNTARSNFENALQVFMNRKRSVSISDKIYRKTLLKYKEGISTSMDIQQSYNQYLESLRTYITSARDLLSAKARLEKALAKD
jgi:outer membrane protein TolC